MISKHKSKKMIKFKFLFLYKKSAPYRYIVGNQVLFVILLMFIYFTFAYIIHESST